MSSTCSSSRSSSMASSAATMASSTFSTCPSASRSFSSSHHFSSLSSRVDSEGSYHSFPVSFCRRPSCSDSSSDPSLSTRSLRASRSSSKSRSRSSRSRSRCRRLSSRRGRLLRFISRISSSSSMRSSRTSRRVSALLSMSTRDALTLRSSSRFTGLMYLGSFCSTLLTRLSILDSSLSRSPVATISAASTISSSKGGPGFSWSQASSSMHEEPRATGRSIAVNWRIMRAPACCCRCAVAMSRNFCDAREDGSNRRARSSATMSRTPPSAMSKQPSRMATE
mmetsp:Transcript_17964/g.43065  ORF Transcript_17964/g.43065 Transcript_17964/m.43065 type:complete len:281 (+) Transcript_17964:158-1000(+)